MSEENKAVLDRINDVFNGGDMDAVDELLAEDFVEHNPMPGGESDREGFKQMVAGVREAFPDLETERHLQVAEGEYVVERWTSTGTHEGEFMGVAPTGNTVTVEGIDISRLADGRVVEHWTQMDTLGLLQQLDVIPEQTEAEASEDVEAAEEEEISEDEAGDEEAADVETAEAETAQDGASREEATA